MNKVRPMGAFEMHRMDRAPMGPINFEQVFALVPTPLLILDRQLVIRFANAAYLMTTGRTLSEIQGQYVFDAFPESDERTAVFRTAFEDALAGTANSVTTEPFAIPAEGGGMREIIWTCTQQPLRNAAGEIEYVMQNARDITAKHAREQENQLLLRELDHRVKNSLATVQAITRMSLTEGKSILDARDELLGRLYAMSEVQSLLVDRNWQGSSVRGILESALRPFGYDPSGEGRIRLKGPRVNVTAKQMQVLTLAIHELATNAAKYGALTSEHGTVDATWTFDRQDGPLFRLIWRETGGPEVVPPKRQGFGTRMLTRILAQAINGEITLDYKSTGLVCTMEGSLETAD